MLLLHKSYSRAMSRLIKTVLSLIVIAAVSSAVSVSAGHGMAVWNEPVAERNYFNHDGYFYPIINVTKVEITPQETVLSIYVSCRPEISIVIPSKACIVAGTDTLTVREARGIDLDAPIYCRRDSGCRFRLVFPPLPEGTAEFDFFSGSGLSILGICDVSRIERRLIPSNWRNEASGDWEIGFYDEGVIYDSRFWDYAGAERPDNSDRFDITDGRSRLTVVVGKLKKGRRSIRIGDRSTTCSMITGRTLPPYPAKDGIPTFRNTGYSGVDTVFISGWLKDMPEPIRNKGDYYELSYTDIFTGKDVETSCRIDSIGRFSMKIPVCNSTFCFMDWDKTFIRTCIEPGETYFLFYDFGRGQKLFMGRNSRLQNELLAHPLTWACLSMGYNFKSTDYDRYLHSVDSLLKEQTAALDSLCAAVPTLSQRFRICQRDHLKSMHAREMGQSRFKNKEFRLPENMARYMYRNFWQTAASPYSVSRDVEGFIRDYIDDYLIKHPVRTSVSTDYILENMDALGFSDSDLVTLRKWKEVQDQYDRERAGVSDSTELKRLSERYTSENAGLLSDAERLLNSERGSDIIMSELALLDLTQEFALLDSLDANEETKNIWLGQKGFNLIDSRRRPLSARLMRFLEENITFAAALDRIRQENQIYVDLEKKVGRSISPAPPAAGEISDSDDGETILRKILAPHRGRIVLLDVWGTWCGPCREALSRSQELYSALANYDMVYVYLANNSPESSWRNIIEQYNVTGDNCFHYNLPPHQQAAVEAYLKVNSYPTYRLFDPNGSLLQVNASPHDLDKLRSVIDRIAK